MRKFSIILLFLAGVVVFLSCEKDETRAVLNDNPVAPGLNVPAGTMVFQRSDADDVLTFAGNSADYGFQAAATYTLEADANNFENPTIIATSIVDTFNITVGALNEKLLTILPESAATTVKFRVKASINSEIPAVYSSVSEVSVTLYGLPSLVFSLTPPQKISSLAGDGNYRSFVKLPANATFTMTNPDDGKTYGGADGILTENGPSIVIPDAGWYDFSASTVDMTYNPAKYFIGLVGSATPNGWDAPDQKMDYYSSDGTWRITLDLVDGAVKFRKNDDWGWNLGGALDNLVGDGTDIPVTAGNYTITLTITDDLAKKGTCTIVKN